MRRRLDKLEPLSTGGLAELYLARLVGSRRRVVVKYLQDPRDAVAVRFFRREVRILRKGLSRTTRLLWANLRAKKPYYVMAYYEGGNLLPMAGALSMRRLRELSLDIALALRQLHDEDIAHGDVKPENILLSRRGALRLADPLGTGTGCTITADFDSGGTPGYWAPEVLAGGSITPQADVFSLGVTIAHLATGWAPRDRWRIARSALNDRASRDIVELVATCCQRDADRRPTIDDVVGQLRRAGAGRRARGSRAKTA